MANKISDQELMKALKIDAKTLGVFKNIQTQTIKEAERLFSSRKGKIKVLGISGSREAGFKCRLASFKVKI